MATTWTARLVMASVLIVGLSAPGFGATLTPFIDSTAPVTLGHIIPHTDDPLNQDEEFYIEQYTVSFYLEGDMAASLQMGISNLGSGDGTAAVTASFKAPGEKRIKGKSKLTRDKWSYSPDTLSVAFGPHTLEGTLGSYHVTLDFPEFKADYTFTNVLPPWRPGNGTIFFGDTDHYYDFTLMAPKAIVEGTVTTKDGKIHVVEGLAYIDHSVTNVAMQDQAKRWIRFRTIKDDHTVIFTYMYTPEKYGNQELGWVYVAKEGKPLFSSLDVTLLPKDIVVDEASASKYENPQKVIVMADGGSWDFKGIVAVTKQTTRHDFLKGLSYFEKMVVKQFAEPISFYHDCAYVSLITGKQDIKLRGFGRYYISQINP